jgi:hypothetical protein
MTDSNNLIIGISAMINVVVLVCAGQQGYLVNFVSF